MSEIKEDLMGVAFDDFGKNDKIEACEVKSVVKRYLQLMRIDKDEEIVDKLAKEIRKICAQKITREDFISAFADILRKALDEEDDD